VTDVVEAGRDAAGALMSCADFVLVACGVARYKGRFVLFMSVLSHRRLRAQTLSHPIYTTSSGGGGDETSSESRSLYVFWKMLRDPVICT
jgi:hypothetical protein